MNVSPLLAVRDLERSVDFYRLIGFEPIVITETYAKLTMNDGALHLAAEGDAPPDRSGVPLRAAGADGSSVSAIVVIEVDDCEEFCRAIVGRGIELLGPPSVPAWGGEVRAFAFDPDKHLLEFNQQTGAADPH
jgi:catechol 2,3-dioxygenase-like lactoylglutathione lyase family enzyme